MLIVKYAIDGDTSHPVTTEFTSEDDCIEWLRNSIVTLIRIERMYTDANDVPCIENLSKTQVNRIIATAKARNDADSSKKLSYKVSIKGTDGYVATAYTFQEMVSSLAVQHYLGFEPVVTQLVNLDGNISEPGDRLLGYVNSEALSESTRLLPTSKEVRVDIAWDYASGPSVGRLTIFKGERILAILEDSPVARQYVAMRAAMEKFVARVENGEVRSSATYAEFKAILAQSDAEVNL